MRRIHPFVYGHVVAALTVGLAAGATLDAQAAGMGAALLTAGAIVSSVVCWWKPGFEAPAWLLIPAAILANPLMLVALGFLLVDSDCVFGSRRGWDCLGAALAILVVGVCLVPPFGGWLVALVEASSAKSLTATAIRRAQGGADTLTIVSDGAAGPPPVRNNYRACFR